MFRRLFIRQASSVVAAFMGMAAAVFITTPASATCWLCEDLIDPGNCIVTMRPNGNVSCLGVSGGCIMGSSCAFTFRGDFDVDGQIVASAEELSSALLSTSPDEASYDTLGEYLQEIGVVRNCKGFILARLSSESPQPVDRTLEL